MTASIWLLSCPAASDITSWIADLVSTTPTRCGIDIVDADQTALSTRRREGSPAGPADWHAIVFDPDAAEQCPASVATSAMRGFLVTEVPAWDRGLPHGDGVPVAGIKQVSFVKKPDELSTELFRERYRGHVAVATEHHIGIGRYVQLDVESLLTEAPPTDGVSELWFASREDYADRFYTGPGSREAVRDDTVRFIDFGGTFSLLVVEHRRGDR